MYVCKTMSRFGCTGEIIMILMYLEELMMDKYNLENNMPENTTINSYEAASLTNRVLEDMEYGRFIGGKHGGGCIGEEGPCMRCIYEEYLNRANSMYDDFVKERILGEGLK
jgi:hypothetical protein